MKLKTKLVFPLVIFIVTLTACGSSQTLEEAKTAVEEFNAKAEKFNESILPYNTAVAKINAENQMLEDAVDSAQASINKGEVPYDEETLTELKQKMVVASGQEITPPEDISSYELLIVDDDASKSELEDLIERANALSEELSDYEMPSIPEIPDYSEEIANLEEAIQVYEDSIQSLKQVTAPTDDFVMERIRLVDTITEMDAVTEDHDPNGQLNKQGGYIGCIYFTDSQVDRSELYIEEGEDNVIDVGTNGGGAIEVFNTVEEAETRNQYLAGFDGSGIFSSGSHYVVGTLVIRTSNYLNGTQQMELNDKIIEELIRVNH